MLPCERLYVHHCIRHPNAGHMAPHDEYEVLIVRYGTRQTHRSDVYLNYAIYGEPDAPIGMDYFFWVIRNRHRTVVVDTGFSVQAGWRRGRTLIVDPAEALALLGIDRDAGPTVVVTHAHYDHIGNLALFPHSPIVMTRRELDFWGGRVAQRAQFSHSVEEVELGQLDAANKAGRIHAFAGTAVVAPGIEALEIGGHTPGQCIVVVRTPAGSVLLASDAIHYYEELERDMPFSLAANLVDMYIGFDRIRGLVADGAVKHVVSGHDPDTVSRFELLPDCPPQLSGHVAVVGRLS